MTRTEWNSILRGAVIRDVITGRSYVVESVRYGDNDTVDRVFLVRIIEAMNPCEWELVKNG